MKRLNQEQRFVIQTVRTALNGLGRRCACPAMKVPSDLDWPTIESLVNHNGVAALLHGYFSQYDSGRLPDHFRKSLARRATAQMALFLVYEKALGEIARAFQAHCVTFVVHKGIALSAWIYPSADLRPPGSDIDIMVKPSDYGRARRCLAEIGYVSEDTATEANEAAFIGEVHLTKQIGVQEIVLDLHIDFNPNHWGKVMRFGIGDVWKDLVQVACDGFSVYHLPVTASLIFLAIHFAANHAFDRLILLCDLDLLIRKHKDSIEWNGLAMQIRHNRCGKPLFFSLDYCRRLLGTPVPLSFLRAISPDPLTRAAVRRTVILVRGKKPSKALERYIHIALLDRPQLIFRSVSIFFARLVSSQRGPRQKSIAPSAARLYGSSDSSPVDRRPCISRITADRKTDLDRAVGAAIDLVGGFEHYLQPSDRILLKPNFNSADAYPASSDLRFITAVIKRLRAAGFTRICLGESSGMAWHPTRHVLDRKGVPQWAHKMDIPLIDFDAQNKWVRVPVRGRYFKHIEIAQAALEADKIIYLPNLKTHSLARFSMALKLGVGFMSPAMRHTLHQDNLEQRIADLNLAIRPNLIVIDGRVCFIRGGPAKGRRKRPGVILAGADPVAIDVEGLKILQSYKARNRIDMPVWQLPQIKAAVKMGIGVCNETSYDMLAVDIR